MAYTPLQEDNGECEDSSETVNMSSASVFEAHSAEGGKDVSWKVQIQYSTLVVNVHVKSDV